MNREFKGIWIPKEIWTSTELTFIEKAIFVEIDSLDGENHCYASNSYFAEFIGCTQRKVSDAITKLKKLGCIEQISFDGRSRILKSNLLTWVEKTSMGIEESSMLVEETSGEGRNNFYATTKKVPPNNIYNNTYNNTKNNKDINTEKKQKEKGSSEPKKKVVAKKELDPRIMQGIENPYFSNRDLNQTFLDFIQNRKDLKKPMTELAIDRTIRKLLSMSRSDAEKIEILNQSIANGWQGIFPLDKRAGKQVSNVRDNDALLKWAEEGQP